MISIDCNACQQSLPADADKLRLVYPPMTILCGMRRRRTHFEGRHVPVDAGHGTRRLQVADAVNQKPELLAGHIDRLKDPLV